MTEMDSDVMSVSDLQQRPLWRRPSRAAWIWLGLYVILALAYNFWMPVFEPSDEILQFEYVRHLIEQRTLPVEKLGEVSAYHHPPLYYFVGAVLSWPFSADDRRDYVVNPYRGFRSWEPGVDNKNLYLHGPWDGWPFHGTSLAVHIARLASLGMGVVTVLLTYQIARALGDEAVASAATGLAALLPMYLVVSSSVQSDAGATMCGALQIWLSLHFFQTGMTAKRAIVLGLVVGAGALMKLTGVLLVMPALATIVLWGWTSRQTLRRQIAYAGLVIISAGISAGWWYWRSWQLYGDPTAMSANLGNFGSQPLSVGITRWGVSLSYAWTTAWGRFGHGEVVLPGWVYAFLTILTLIGLMGLVRFLWTASRNRRVLLGLLGIAGLAQLAGLLYYATISPTGANARYAFPALPAYFTLLASGGLALIPNRARSAVATALPTLMAAFAVWALAAYLIPAYYPPAPLDQLPPSAQPLNGRLSNLAVIRGYELSSSQAYGGESVYVTIYWQPLSRTSLPYSVYVHLLDEGGNLIAQRDTYPGLGRYPTTAWEPGGLFPDRYQIVLPDTVDEPLTAHWKVGLGQLETLDSAYLLDDAGQPIDSGLVFGELIVLPKGR